MFVNLANTSEVSSDIGINIKRKDPLALSFALRSAQQLYAASRVDSKFKSILTSLAGKLNTEIERALIQELGGGRITAGKGGFYPDYFIQAGEETELKELKLISTVETDTGVKRKGPVNLGGGGGVLIPRGKADLLTGFDTSSGSPKPQVAKGVHTTALVNRLLKAKDDQKKLFEIISGKGLAVTAIRNTMIAKASSIEIPVTFRGRLEHRSIQFSFKDLKKIALSNKGRITIRAVDKGLKINFSFFGSTITKALNSTQAITIRHLQGSIGQTVAQAASMQVALAGPNTHAELNAFLKGLGFNYALNYASGSSGAAKISSGIVHFDLPEKNNKQQTAQGFISGAQLSILVNERLEVTMGKGTPNTPWLKERSGDFRKSVEIFPNYRTGTMIFDYDRKPYDYTIKHGYTPANQVAKATREVIQSLFARQFKILRK